MGWYDYRGCCFYDAPKKKESSEIPKDQLPEYPVHRINHSRRIYNSNDVVDNHVAYDHLDDHIRYNKEMRFGTALFINGVCVNRGYLGKERCDAFEIEIKKMIEEEHLISKLQLKSPTVPYR